VWQGDFQDGIESDLDRIGLNVDQEYGQTVVFLKCLLHMVR
jgi:hypothetical protein